jgi:hypothetical protein
MQERAKVVDATLKEQGIQRQCTYTSFDDCMRADSSLYGSNIADFGVKIRNAEGEPCTYGFKVRSDNFNEELVEVDARRFKIVVCDADGQNPRLLALSDVLRNAGAHFGHYGLQGDLNLYDPDVDDGKIKLRIETFFAPMGERSGDGPAKAEFAITKFSYQARDGNARNLDLFSHPQGTSVSDDRTGTKTLFPEAWVDGKGSSYWIEAEETGKSIKDLATETQAESEAAVARGKGMAVEAGCAGWPKLPCLFFTVQVPLQQQRTGSETGLTSLSTPLDPMQETVCPSFVSADPPLGRSLKVAEGDSDDDLPVPRSLNVEEGDAAYVTRSLRAAEPLKTAASSGVRLSRGERAGDALGVLSKRVTRAKGEPCSITVSLVIAQAGDSAPEQKSVVEIMQLVDKLTYIAGNKKRLFDAGAGLTSGAPLSQQEAFDILSKKQAVSSAGPPQPGMVA